MSNQITQTLLDNAIKSLVAYGTIKSTHSPAKIMEELTRTDFFADVKFSKEEAMGFMGIVEKADEAGNTFYDFQTDENENRTTGHTILTSSQELGIGYFTGFDAVILKDNATGEISFSVAGTNPLSLLDMLSNADLAAGGSTLQEAAMEDFYQTAVAKGVISADDKLVMNGHSLGGYLIAKFTQNHPDVVAKAYTFNGAGIGSFTTDIEQLLGADVAALMNEKIINVAADGYLSMIEDLGVNPGTPDVEVGAGNSHSIVNIIAALRNNQITSKGADILAEAYLRDHGFTVNSANKAAISSKIIDNESITPELHNQLRNNNADDGTLPFLSTEEQITQLQTDIANKQNELDGLPPLIDALKNLAASNPINTYAAQRLAYFQQQKQDLETDVAALQNQLDLLEGEDTDPSPPTHGSNEEVSSAFVSNDAIIIQNTITILSDAQHTNASLEPNIRHQYREYLKNVYGMTDAIINQAIEYHGRGYGIDDILSQYQQQSAVDQYSFDGHASSLGPWADNIVFNTDDEGNVSVIDPDQTVAIGDVFAAEQTIHNQFQQGQATAQEKAAFTDYARQQALIYDTSQHTPSQHAPSQASEAHTIPIGAFYDSQSAQYDHAASIAEHTGVLLDSQTKPLTVAQLQALDSNHDGQLSGAETATLRLWQDSNENGHLDNNELTSLTQLSWSITQQDYGFYTTGNGQVASSQPAQAVQATYAQPIANTAAQPANEPIALAVPDSNYRTLRDNDNFYANGNGSIIAWDTSYIKINQTNYWQKRAA